MSATFRHVSFIGKRTAWDCTQIAGCVADAAPNSNFVPCAPEFLCNAQHLYTVAGVRYMGWN